MVSANHKISWTIIKYDWLAEFRSYFRTTYFKSVQHLREQILDFRIIHEHENGGIRWHDKLILKQAISFIMKMFLSKAELR